MALTFASNKALKIPEVELICQIKTEIHKS